MWGGGGRLRWGRSRQGTLRGERGWGLDMRFHQILPEAKSSSRCTNVVVWIPKVWGEEKCAKVPFSHWGERGKCYFKKKTLQLYSDPESECLTSVPFTFPKDVCSVLTPQLFGYSPPPFPPASSPPRTSRSPFRLSSSFLACAEGCEDCDFLLTGYSWKEYYKGTSQVPICIIKFS